jgi:hypothetical protein
MTLNDTFTDNEGKHRDNAGNDCPSRQFKVSGCGRGGIYTHTVKCVECGKEFEALEKRLRKKP